jgi:hypothetical protein
MRVQFELKDGRMLAAPVKGVEFIDRIAADPGETDIGLVLDEDDPEMQRLWKTVTVGHRLELSES